MQGVNNNFAHDKTMNYVLKQLVFCSMQFHKNTVIALFTEIYPNGKELNRRIFNNNNNNNITCFLTWFFYLFEPKRDSSGKGESSTMRNVLVCTVNIT